MLADLPVKGVLPTLLYDINCLLEEDGIAQTGNVLITSECGDVDDAVTADTNNITALVTAYALTYGYTVTTCAVVANVFTITLQNV
jgi:hypothetical protein